MPSSQKFVSILIPESVLQNAEHGRGYTQEAVDASLCFYVRKHAPIEIAPAHDFRPGKTCHCGKTNHADA